MIFATSCYGRYFAPCLAVCLRALRQKHPDDPVLVIYDGLPRRIVRALIANNPNATFRKCDGQDLSDQIRDFSGGEPATFIDAAAIGDPSGEIGAKWGTMLRAEEEETDVSLMPWRYRLAGILRSAINRQPPCHS